MCKRTFLLLLLPLLGSASPEVTSLNNERNERLNNLTALEKKPTLSAPQLTHSTQNTKTSFKDVKLTDQKQGHLLKKDLITNHLGREKYSDNAITRRQFIPSIFRGLGYPFLQRRYGNRPSAYGRQPQDDNQDEYSGPCLARPCHNEGSCMRKRHGYYCSCAPGYIGSHCENRMECDSETCKNGGSCTEESMGRHVCTCKIGFRGENCQDTSKCHPNPCRNGGECSETDDSYTCLCKESYKGKNCDEMNQCDPNPCKNSGTCFEQDAGYYCNCPSMYRGKTCEVISECSRARCVNGGTCLDSTNGFKCKCPYGFYGNTCEANPCQPNPCLNNGICSMLGHQYVCQCSQGYSGRNCEVHSFCNRNICLNGGTCVDSAYTTSTYGFACVCPKDFDGILCEQKVPDVKNDQVEQR